MMESLVFPELEKKLLCSAPSWNAYRVAERRHAVTIQHGGVDFASLALSAPLVKAKWTNGADPLLVVLTTDGNVHLCHGQQLQNVRRERVCNSAGALDGLQVSQHWIVVNSSNRVTVLHAGNDRVFTLDLEQMVLQVNISPLETWLLMILKDGSGYFLPLLDPDINALVHVAAQNAVVEHQLHWQFGDHSVFWASGADMRLVEVSTGRILRHVFSDNYYPLSFEQLMNPRGDAKLRGLILRAHRKLHPLLHWVPHTSQLVTCTPDGCMYVWESRTGSIDAFYDHEVEWNGTAISFSPDARWSVVRADGTLKLYHMGKLARALDLPDPVMDFLILTNVVVVLCETLLHVVSLAQNQTWRTTLSRSHWQTHRFVEDWWALETSSEDVRVMAVLHRESRIGTLHLGTFCPIDLCLLVVPRLVIMVDANAIAQCWDLTTNQITWQRVMPDVHRCLKMHLSPCGTMLVQFGLAEEQVLVHALGNGLKRDISVPRNTDAHDNGIVFAFSLCGTWLAYTCGKSLHMLHLKERRHWYVPNLRHAPSPIASLSFAEDRKLAVSFADGLIHVLNESEWNGRFPLETNCSFCGVELAHRQSHARHERACARLSPRTRKARVVHERPSFCKYCAKHYHPSTLRKHESRCKERRK